MRARLLFIHLLSIAVALCACAVEGTDFPSDAETANNGFNGNNGVNNGTNNGRGNNGNNDNNGFDNNGNGGNNVGAPDFEGCFSSQQRDECEQLGCLWIVPGCDEAPDAFVPACHPPVGCDGDAFDCPDGLICRSVTYDPCLPQENGSQCGACGAELQACVFPDCTLLDEAGCEAAGCRYLVPGCTDPALPEAGCFPADDCQTDADCGAGLTCQDAVYDPCAGEDCDACGASARICLP